jgi:structural maintenance of chromosome 4
LRRYIQEKQHHLEHKMAESARNASKEAGAPPRLIDLIKPAEPRLAVAFYYGVRETAVADDLDTASKIAYEGRQRRRVVTLAGRGLHSFRFQLNLSSSVHRIPHLTS